MRVLLRNWILISIAIVAPLPAQQGHPLVGSWHGTWGPNAKDRNDVTVIFNWDGKSITGLVNPGLDVMKIENATLDPPFEKRWGGWYVTGERSSVSIG
jgi:hypothetical protein